MNLFSSIMLAHRRKQLASFRRKSLYFESLCDSFNKQSDSLQDLIDYNMNLSNLESDFYCLTGVYWLNKNQERIASKIQRLRVKATQAHSRSVYYLERCKILEEQCGGK